MEPDFSLSELIDLPAWVASYAPAYQRGEPYPHIVMDDFLPESILKEVVREFPSTENWPLSWGKRNDQFQRKFGSRGRDLIPPVTMRLIDELNSPSFLDFLSGLTGIPDLMADPDLIGAGLHQIAREGYLAIHADFNKAHHRDRRLNLLVYLNEDWEEDWGGHFEMWNRDLTRKVKSVSPVFNRVVVFSTDETSYHGHPQPLRCPTDRTRKSIALYYYTRGVREDKVSDKFKFEYVDTNWKVPERKMKLM